MITNVLPASGCGPAGAVLRSPVSRDAGRAELLDQLAIAPARRTRNAPTPPAPGRSRAPAATRSSDASCDVVNRPEVIGQHLRAALADVADAEAVEQPPHIGSIFDFSISAEQVGG